VRGACPRRLRDAKARVLNPGAEVAKIGFPDVFREVQVRHTAHLVLEASLFLDNLYAVVMAECPHVQASHCQVQFP